jgi:hypothetical protein
MNVLSNPTEEMTDAEVTEAIGTYFTNFATYGLCPKVWLDPEYGGYHVKLRSFNGEFKMTVQAGSLVDALRQADMAAGGWHAQRELEDNLLGKKLEAEMGGLNILNDGALSSANVSQLLLSITKAMDTVDVPQHCRTIHVNPSVYKALGAHMKTEEIIGRPFSVDGTPVVMNSQLSATSSQPLTVRSDGVYLHSGLFGEPSP